MKHKQNIKINEIYYQHSPCPQQYTILRRPVSDHSYVFPIRYDYTQKSLFRYQYT